MTVPETGVANATMIAIVRTANGTSHRFTTMGVIPELLAGPVQVAVEATIAVAESPPPPRTLRDKLERVLRVEDCVDDQVDAVLELLSEQENLLDQLEELSSE